MSKHTKGPWYFTDHTGTKTHGFAVTEADGQHVARVPRLELGDNSRRLANAQLISAAPDLLAALRAICDSGAALAEPIERQMLEAIRKAEFRS